MKPALLFTWFPLLLGVGIGARLIGQARGFGLGALAALFWIVLVQAEGGVGLWRDPWQVSALAAGAFVLVMMGGWSGQNDARNSARSAENTTTGEEAKRAAAEDVERWGRMGTAFEQFDDWLSRHAHERNPWPKFAEFVRGVLYECCQATHVKCFRFMQATEDLRDLDDAGGPASSISLSARSVREQVFQTGQSFLAGLVLTSEADLSDAALPLQAGYERAGAKPAWCFAIGRSGQRLGLVTAEQFGPGAPPRSYLMAVEKLVESFWVHLLEVNLNRMAGDEDPVSGLLNRQAFLRSADAALRQCFDQGEPVALAVVGVQGLRQLNDAGRWELADELVQEIGRTLQSRARLDDRLGRFDGSRFIWLLRRVDGELARLILRHVMGRLEQVCSSEQWGVQAGAYCGLAGSGKGKADLRRLVTAALQLSQRARVEGTTLVSDQASSPAPMERAAAGAGV